VSNENRSRPVEPVRAMPEWLTREDRPTEAYRVEEGAARRGEAWTNISEARMRVPFGRDDTSRVIRAHEMVHAKVSPVTLERELVEGWHLPMDLLIAAEEMRVNMLVGMAGFDPDALCDGSEVRAGEIAGQNNDWNGAVHSLLAMAGTKAGNDFVRGVGKHNKEMELALREVHKAVKKEWRAIVRDNGRDRAGQRIGSTEVHRAAILDTDDDVVYHEVPFGFMVATKRLAEFAAAFLIGEGEPGDGDAEIPTPGEAEQMGKTRGNARFARLIEKPVPKPRRSDGIIGRKRVATNVGRNPRRINRMLTDPEKRVFDRKVRGRGGIVLIDQSGSMSLTEDDIYGLLEAAPGCVIIGYSHRPGSSGVPNIWVIADRGQVCERGHIPTGNGGNGVDGPAVEFAQKRRRKGEPFIWVCDGVVTDHRDHYMDNLGTICRRQVEKYGIHMVETPDEAIAALKRAEHQTLPARVCGPYLRKSGDEPDGTIRAA